MKGENLVFTPLSNKEGLGEILFSLLSLQYLLPFVKEGWDGFEIPLQSPFTKGGNKEIDERGKFCFYSPL